MAAGKDEKYFKDWKQREEIAEAMIPSIGRLYRDREVICTIFNRSLVHQSTIDILRVHRYARQIIDKELWVTDTFPILQAIEKLDLAPGRIDLAKLAIAAQEQKITDIDSFVKGFILLP